MHKHIATHCERKVGEIASRIALADAAGQGHFVDLSSLQAAATVQLIKEATLTPVDAVEVTSIAAGVGWSDPSHLRLITAELVKPCKQLQKQRRQQQDFTCFMEYGTAEFWKLLLGRELGPEQRLMQLCTFLIELGLRCPSVKLLCSTWLVATHSKLSLDSIDSGSKMAFYKHTQKQHSTS